MKLSFTNRKTNVLANSTLQCFGKRVAAINPTIGCVHKCSYCYVRGYLRYPGDGYVVVYDNLVEKLKLELSRKRILPETVFFSTACDTFQPIPQVLKITHTLMQILLDHGISVSFLTKGYIPSYFLDLFEPFPHLVQAKIGFITIDRKIQQTFEPYATSPQKRLENIKNLTARKINTEVRMDPIIPGVTDNQAQLKEYFQIIEDLNVKSIILNYLLLRNRIKNNLKAVTNAPLYEMIVNKYKKGGKINLKAENSTAVAVNKDYREAKYKMITNLASNHNISVSICGCKNSDITDNLNCGKTLSGITKNQKNQLSLF